LSNAQAPTIESTGKCIDGTRQPKDMVWEDHYDPIHVMSMAVTKTEYVNAHSRYME